MISIRKKPQHSQQTTGVKTGFLNFSQKTDYGLVLLSALVKADSPVALSLREIAKSNLLSFFFLQKVALELRQAGLIEADRGKNGGYRLSKKARAISLKEVLEALEGPVAVMHCLGHSPEKTTCVREADCGIQGGFGMLNQLILETLSKLTLFDFLHPQWNKRKMTF